MNNDSDVAIVPFSKDFRPAKESPGNKGRSVLLIIKELGSVKPTTVWLPPRNVSLNWPLVILVGTSFTPSL